MTVCGGENQFQVSKCCCLQPLRSDGRMWDESSGKLFLQELNAVIGAFRFNSSERRMFNRWCSGGVAGVESGGASWSRGFSPGIDTWNG